MMFLELDFLTWRSRSTYVCIIYLERVSCWCSCHQIASTPDELWQSEILELCDVMSFRVSVHDLYIVFVCFAFPQMTSVWCSPFGGGCGSVGKEAWWSFDI